MKILVGIPTYDRRIDIEIVKTLFAIERMGKHHLDFLFPVSSHIARNRNYICREAINGKYDTVLFWDSDIGIPNGNFLDMMLETAYKLDTKIVGGAYLMKKPNEKVYVSCEGLKDGNPDNIRERAGEPRLVKAVGTGIMLIFREVLEKLDDPWFTIVDKKNLDVIPEDFYFCEKASEKGFTIGLDTRFETRHYGSSPWVHQ